MRVNDLMSRCITNCSDTHDVVLQAALHGIQQGFDASHVRLLLDCAQICDTSRDFMLRESSLHQQMCGQCADVCEAVVQICESYTNDSMMQNCAQMCRSCASSCREMASGSGQIPMAA